MENRGVYLVTITLFIGATLAADAGLSSSKKATDERTPKELLLEEIFSDDAKPEDTTRTLELLKQYQQMPGPQHSEFVDEWIAACDASEVKPCEKLQPTNLSGQQLSKNVLRVLQPLMDECGRKRLEVCLPPLMETLKTREQKLSEGRLKVVKLFDEHLTQPIGATMTQKQKLAYVGFMDSGSIKRGVESLLAIRPNLINNNLEDLTNTRTGLTRRQLLPMAKLCHHVVDRMKGVFNGVMRLYRAWPNNENLFEGSIADWNLRYQICQQLTSASVEVEGAISYKNMDEDTKRRWMEEDEAEIEAAYEDEERERSRRSKGKSWIRRLLRKKVYEDPDDDDDDDE